MALETWIDAAVDVFKFTYAVGQTVRVFPLYSSAGFPNTLTDFPCAVTFPTALQPQYGEGLGIDIWQGRTELHLFPSADKMLLQKAVPYFGLIKTAMATHVTLGGLVTYFLPAESEAITGPVELVYGNEAPHWGIVVKWIVKELSNTAVSG